jgi:PAS domain S-box-containing protein
VAAQSTLGEAGNELDLHARLLHLVASNRTLSDLLDALVRFVEGLSVGMRCSILVADRVAGVMRHGAAPSLPKAFIDAIDGVPIGEGNGSCGTAAARGRMVVVTDIGTDPLWAGYSDVAHFHGLHACWSTPFVDDSGQLLGTCAMYYNEPRAPTRAEINLIVFAGSLAGIVMQRHRDALELRTGEANYRQLAEASPDAIFTLDESLITYVNPAGARLLGVTDVGDAIGHSLLEYIDAQFRDAFAQHRDGIMATTLIRRDGTARDIEAAATPMHATNELTRLMIFRDVTERRSVETEVIDATTREQERLAHNLHDGLGQLLTGISLHLRALTNRSDGRFASELIEIAELVTRATKESRMIAAGMSPLGIDQMVLGEALDVLAQQARELYGLEVVMSVNTTAAASVEPATATEIYRIVQEALSNIARHAHATLAFIDMSSTDSAYTLSVSDDGIGMPEASQGTEGLGLRILRYRTRRIGGHIQFLRRSPRGTTIRVSWSTARARNLVGGGDPLNAM